MSTLVFDIGRGIFGGQMSEFLYVHKKGQIQFSVVRYLGFMGLHLPLLYAVVWWLHPAALERNLGAAWWEMILVFMGGRVVMSLVEFLFHRDILHAAPWPWVNRFHGAHELHHALTPASSYAIEKEAQLEAAVFPAFTLWAFWALFSALIVPAQLLFPHVPIYIGGYMAVVSALVDYEILHAGFHRPYEWWLRYLKHPIRPVRWVGERAYKYHLMHHECSTCNEAIAGCFYFALWDWVFRTLKMPKFALVEGKLDPREDLSPPVPPKLIRRLDCVVAIHQAIWKLEDRAGRKLTAQEKSKVVAQKRVRYAL
jgi:hypothetical protein